MRQHAAGGASKTRWAGARSVVTFGTGGVVMFSPILLPFGASHFSPADVPTTNLATTRSC